MRPDYVASDPIARSEWSSRSPALTRAVVQAVNVGRSIASDVRAVYISDDPERSAAMREQLGATDARACPLVLVESPYRALVGPLVAYLDVLDRAWPPDKPAPITFVVLPEYVARHWWERILYNQTAKRLKAALIDREHTVVADVPYRRGSRSHAEHKPDGYR